MIKHAFDEINPTLLTTCVRHCRVSFLPGRSRDTKACFHSGPVTYRKTPEIADSLLLIGRGVHKYSLATLNTLILLKFGGKMLLNEQMEIPSEVPKITQVN